MHPQNTLDLDLRLFVTTSSIAAIVGGMGMAGKGEIATISFSSEPRHSNTTPHHTTAYSAANAYLDALVRFRRQQGLPAATFNLTSLSDVGILANNLKARRFHMKARAFLFSSVFVSPSSSQYSPPPHTLPQTTQTHQVGMEFISRYVHQSFCECFDGSRPSDHPPPVASIRIWNTQQDRLHPAGDGFGRRDAADRHPLLQGEQQGHVSRAGALLAQPPGPSARPSVSGPRRVTSARHPRLPPCLSHALMLPSMHENKTYTRTPSRWAWQSPPPLTR